MGVRDPARRTPQDGRPPQTAFNAPPHPCRYDPVELDDPFSTVVPDDRAVLEYAYGLDTPEELAR